MMISRIMAESTRCTSCCKVRLIKHQNPVALTALQIVFWEIRGYSKPEPIHRRAVKHFSKQAGRRSPALWASRQRGLLFSGYIAMLYAIRQISDENMECVFSKKLVCIYRIAGNDFPVLFLMVFERFFAFGKINGIMLCGEGFVGTALFLQAGYMLDAFYL